MSCNIYSLEKRIVDLIIASLVLIDSEAKTKDLVNQESVPLCPEWCNLFGVWYYRSPKHGSYAYVDDKALFADQHKTYTIKSQNCHNREIGQLMFCGNQLTDFCMMSIFVFNEIMPIFSINVKLNVKEYESKQIKFLIHFAFWLTSITKDTQIWKFPCNISWNYWLCRSAVCGGFRQTSCLFFISRWFCWLWCFFTRFYLCCVGVGCFGWVH